MSATVTVNRDFTLDFVKGILVVFMVVYHVMNIFSTAGWEAYGYIRFVSGSFLFISGYIITIYSEKKFQASKVATTKRQIIRGLKLLMIFTALNLVINLTGVGNPDKAQLGVRHYLDNLYDIYVFGLPKTASFQVLLPIAYLLILSPVFLFFSRINILLTMASFTAAFLLSYSDVESVNFGLGIVGFIGLCSGMLVNKYDVSIAIKKKAVIAFSLLICFFLMKYLDRNIVTYSLGIIFFIKLFYDLGMLVNLKNSVNRSLILIGQYSLICYIAQIVFLQFLSILLSREKWELGYESIVLIVITNIFLLVMCRIVKLFRIRYRFIDQSYRFIFS